MRYHDPGKVGLLGIWYTNSPSPHAAWLGKVSLHLLVGSQAMCGNAACVHDWRAIGGDAEGILYRPLSQEISKK